MDLGSGGWIGDPVSTGPFGPVPETREPVPLNRPRRDVLFACARCGRETPERASFCPACGAPLNDRSAPWDLRKTVTVLFCDVVGSTEIAERLDPESVRRVMSRYFEEMRLILEHHGATVEKFIGDAVMAAFGIPRVHEDDALRAVRSAVEMRERLHVLNGELEQRWDVTIRARIGISTGEVVAGDPSLGESFVTGDAVNVAARLEQAAEPSGVLIEESTYQRVVDAVTATPVGELTLKGKSRPTRTYRVLDVRPVTEHVKRFESPMVGRKAQIDTLSTAFERVLAERACRQVNVLGAAGVGKTRLVEEFVEGIAGSARVLRGRCLPYGEGITYGPVLDLVRQAARIGDADPPALARTKIGALLEETPDGKDVAEQIARLLGLETQAAAQEAFLATRRLLETLAISEPLVVVFDDLQWAEPTFLDLVQYLADRTRRSPLLVICMARPEVLRSRPGWAGVDPYLTSIVLDPLDQGESDHLLTNLLGEGMPRADRLRIVKAAEGNPLFIEEMLWMLIEKGLLKRSDVGWEPTGDISGAPVPPTIQAILAARLDALEPSERSVIERASVIGEVFYWGAVSDISPETLRPDVGAHLMTLERRQLIKPAPSDLAGQDAYRFRHLLVRDAAYREIPKAVRAEIHESFADWLEQTSGERQVEHQEIVGYHLEQAHRYLAELGPIDEHGRDLGDRAADHLVASGLRAWDRGDEGAATGLLNRSLELLPVGDARRVDPLLTLADPAYWTGWASKESMAEEARTIGSLCEDPVLIARSEPVYLAQRWMAHPGTVLPDEVISATDRAISILRSTPDTRSVTTAELLRGLVEGARGRMADASVWYERALEDARRAENPRAEAQAAGALGDVLLNGPIPAELAVPRLQTFLDQVVGNRLAAIELSLRLGTLLLRWGRRTEGGSMMSRTRAAAVDLGYGTGVLLLDYYMAVAVWPWEGDLADGEQVLRQMSVERAQDIGFLSSILADLALNLCAQGRFDDAEPIARKSLEITAPGDLYSAVICRAALARSVAHGRSADEGARFADEAVTLTDGIEWPDLRVTALRALADTQRRNGRVAEGLATLRECIALYEAKGFEPSAERLRAEVAELQPAML